ncbi:MAG: hypothetical protein SGI74_00025 [Oligoflexia bacterium]|nr:hypothetical protein [Oligoflexia bacterium]
MSRLISTFSSFLVTILIAQISFGPLAIASPALVPYAADPYWTNPNLGGSVDPFNRTSWWNANSNTPLSSTNNTITSNPWSYTTNAPIWDSTGPGGSSGWGDPSITGSDTYGLYGAWNSNSVSKQTDVPWMKFIRLSGVLDKNYNAIIQVLRQQSGYEDDDLIADKIISDGGRFAAMVGASGSLITSLLNLALNPNPQNNAGAPANTDFGNLITYLGIAPEAAILAIRQISMVMTLAALYGELPAEDEDRIAVASVPFGVSLGITTANKVLTQMLVKRFMAKQVVVEIGKIAAAQAASQVAITTGAEIIGMAVATQAAAGVTSRVATGKFAKLVKFFVPPLVMALKAITAGALDYGSTTIIGRNAKNYYRKAELAHKSKSILAIKSESKAKHALWLVLSRDVFPVMVEDATRAGLKISALDDTKRFAAILDKAVPLVVNERWNEYETMMNDYNANILPASANQPARSVIIDEYLLALGKDWDLHAKLYLVQIVMAGMLMKGGLTYHDNQVLDTMAIELRLYPPPKVELSQFKPNDPRIDARGRYLQLKRRMQESVAQAENMKAAKRIKNKDIPTPIRNFSGGQLLLEFIQIDKIVRACENRPSTGEIDLCIGDEIAKSAAKPY